MRKLIIGLAMISSISVFAEEMGDPSDNISVGECTVGTQGAQDTPYAEFKISFSQIDLEMNEAIGSVKDYAHSLFIGSKINNVTLVTNQITRKVRFYKNGVLSAEQNCNSVRDNFLSKGVRRAFIDPCQYINCEESEQ